MVDPGVVISFEKPSFPALLSIDHTSPLRVWMEVWWAGFPTLPITGTWPGETRNNCHSTALLQSRNNKYFIGLLSFSFVHSDNYASRSD